MHLLEHAFHLVPFTAAFGSGSRVKNFVLRIGRTNEKVAWGLGLDRRRLKNRPPSCSKSRREVIASHFAPSRMIRTMLTTPKATVAASASSVNNAQHSKMEYIETAWQSWFCFRKKAELAYNPAQWWLPSCTCRSFCWAQATRRGHAGDNVRRDAGNPQTSDKGGPGSSALWTNPGTIRVGLTQPSKSAAIRPNFFRRFSPLMAPNPVKAGPRRLVAHPADIKSFGHHA